VASLVEFNQAMALETEGKRLDEATLTAGVRAVFASDERGFYAVAEENGSVLGGLLVTREWSDWRNAWFWWIQSVYVVPEARGKGLYRELSAFVWAKALEAGNVCGIRLYVEKENKVAQEFRRVSLKGSSAGSSKIARRSSSTILSAHAKRSFSGCSFPASPAI